MDRIFVRFVRVVEFNTKRVDRAIAEKAIARLRIDRDKGHILMARVDDVSRAKTVYEIYRQHAEFNPVQLQPESSRSTPRGDSSADNNWAGSDRGLRGHAWRRF